MKHQPRKYRNCFIPGLSPKNVEIFIQKEESLKRSSIKGEDSSNREYVVNKIIEKIKNGLSIDQAIEEIMKDPIVKQFEYLTKNGLEIKQCFRNWIKPYIKKEDLTGEISR